MPVTRTETISDPNISGEIKISTSFDKSDSGVRFSNESTQFSVEITNKTDKKFKENSRIRWFLAIGQGRPEPFLKGGKFICPAPGETATIEVDDDPLSLEGHAIVGVGGAKIQRNRGADDEIRFRADNVSRQQYIPLATFPVWDRSHYHEIHERPLQTQRISVFTSVAVVALALFQSLSALGYTEYGVCAAAASFLIYLIVGDVPRIR